MELKHKANEQGSPVSSQEPWDQSDRQKQTKVEDKIFWKIVLVLVFCFSYSYMRQTKLSGSLVNFWAHYKIDWLIGWSIDWLIMCFCRMDRLTNAGSRSSIGLFYFCTMYRTNLHNFLHCSPYRFSADVWSFNIWYLLFLLTTVF